MNPFETPSKHIEDYFMDWSKMYPKPYNKKNASPFTKTRIILLNGTEFESNWFLHQFARNCNNNDLRREIAIIRNQEQQQQKRISCLKPLNENILEETIGYEQLAIELTAILAQNEPCPVSKAALDFALLEDFDHLYRFANLLHMDFGIDADVMVGKFTEIMPGRPTINEHRHPVDNVRPFMNSQKADPYTKLVAGIITAAEQQTMNFYMNMAQTYKNHLGRRLFSEIAMVEEEHVTQYESLKDPNCTWLEQWVMHEYTECYLYYSAMMDETDDYIRSIWQDHFEMEVAHLKRACELLEEYEGTPVSKVIPNPEFPKLLAFGENIEYIREVLKTVGLTSVLEEYVPACELPKDHRFFMHLNRTNRHPDDVASHEVIEAHIAEYGEDYRFETKKHPIRCLQSRTEDNITAGTK
jgi:rubrerythrin